MKELTAEQGNVMVGTRHCSHCTLPIETRSPWKVWSTTEQWAAWLAGYCTPMCQRNSAMTAVVTKTAWWLKEATR